MGNATNIVEDCMDGLEYLAANAAALDLDIDNVVTVGHSAGGHLALMAGYLPSSVQVKGVLDLSGVVDFVTDYKKTKGAETTKFYNAFCGGTISEAEECFEAMDPRNHVTEATPPTLIVQGMSDLAV